MNAPALAVVESPLLTEAEWAARTREASRLARREPWASKRTWIYFVQAGSAVKIGHAQDVDARLRLIRVDNAEEVRLLAKIHGTVAGEKAIQERFAVDRIRGEWFCVTPKLLEFASFCRVAA